MGVSRQTALRIIYWNVIVAILIVSLGAVFVIRRMHRYDTLIVEVAREHGVDPRLVSALIWAESRFDPSQVGEAGEVGLMQVTMPAAREWAQSEGLESISREELFDPRINVRAGTWYLARAIRNWGDLPDPLPYALAEYNAGRSNALRWSKKGGADARVFWESITYPTTQRYVRDILTRYRGGV
jgi:soluble lytic murein transglycosylase